MMMMGGGNSKKFAELLVSRMPKAQGVADENSQAFQDRAAQPESDVDEAELAAAHDLLSAINLKDAHKIALALRDAFQIFDKAEDAEEGEGDSEGPEPEPAE